VTSGKVGCLAPCYLGGGSRSKDTNQIAVLDDFVAENDTRLVFDTSNRVPAPEQAAGIETEYRLGVTYERQDRMVTMNDGSVKTVITVDTFLGSRHANQRSGRTETPPPIGSRYRFGEEPVIRALGTHVPPVDEGSRLAVKVTTGQDGCIIFNTDTDDICLDSRKPEEEPKWPC